MFPLSGRRDKQFGRTWTAEGGEVMAGRNERRQVHPSGHRVLVTLVMVYRDVISLEGGICE